MFYEHTNSSIICNLCHHHCTLKNGQSGLCSNKINDNNTLYASNYGRIISMGMDPIEKKPLYHYHPGSKILSVAQAGCNLKCPFCQNSEISQHNVQSSDIIEPQQLRNIMDNYQYSQIAFTYTEPLMWYEYIYDFASQNSDIDIILVTNGCIEKEPARVIAPFIDAANIDIKSFNDKYYASVLGGSLKHVKNTVSTLFESNTHVELTFLLIEGDNDDVNEFSALLDFIAGMSTAIPLHISRYFPSYNYNKPPTSMDRLIDFYQYANQRLDYVYLGNVPDKQYTNTYCPQCGNVLIERDIYATSLKGMDGSECSQCGHKTGIVL